MILRKPYAIFIKYFKLLHIIMAFFVSFILFSSYKIYSFFRIYSIDYRSVMGSFSPNNYVNIIHFTFVLAVLALTIVLLVVMIYKDKPKNVYIYNLLIYIYVLVLLFFSKGALSDARSVVLDIKLSKAIRDLSLIACGLESLSLILVIVRAIGFDIKRFDFGTDLQQLDISEQDSEEIEVALDFDKDSIRRNINNKIRNFKYFYFEHRFIINVVVLCLIISISIYSYFRIRAYSAEYKMGNSFDVGNTTINVQDAYLLDSNLYGNKIASDDGVIVAVRVQFKGFGNKPRFNNGIVTLKIGDLSYSQNSSYATELTDIGTAYINQELSSEFKSYLITFEVASSQAKKNMYLKFNDVDSYVNGKVGARNVFVKLKVNDLRKEDDNVYSKKLTEKINFSDSILNSSSLVINSFDINNKFKLNYNYCYRNDKCINSYEYLSASATGSYFKTLMKISGEINIEKGINNSSIYDLRTFLNSFGIIHYKINNEWKKSYFNSSLVKPRVASTNDYFIEVPYDVKDSSELYLTFKIRNKTYKYVLK